MKPKSSSTKSKSDAARGAVRSSEPQPPSVTPPRQRDGSQTVGALIRLYLHGYADRGGKDVSRAQRLDFWQAKVGHLALAALDDDCVHDALAELAKQRPRRYAGVDADGKPILKGKADPYSGATLNRYSAALSAVLQWAIHERITPKGYVNPCHALKAKEESAGVIRFLTDAERERLLKAARKSKWPLMYALVLAALVTGARKGELQRLRWRDIDFEAGLATIEITKNGDPKLARVTTQLLAELLKHRGAPDALLFGSRLAPGKPFQWSRQHWPALIKAAKLTSRFRFHDLRHSCASYLAQKGASLVEIADVLGHRNLAVTKRYSHLSTGHRAALVDRVLGAM